MRRRQAKQKAQTFEAPQLVSLAEVLAAAPAGHVPAPGFTAHLLGPLVGGHVASRAVVTGTVGERTVAVTLEDGESWLARIPDVLVDPGRVKWVPKGRPPRGSWVGKRAEETVGEELAQLRAASNGRARQDQGVRWRKAEEQRLDAPGSPDTGAWPEAALAPIEAGEGVDGPVETPGPVGAAGVPPRDGHSDQVGDDPGAAPPRPEGRPTADPGEGVGRAAQRTEASTPPVSSAGLTRRCPTPPLPALVEAQPKVETADRMVGPRSCKSCGTELPQHNRLGLCTRCQTTCPTCGGMKAAQAERCRPCRWEPAGLAVDALATAADLQDLPELVRELHDHYVTLARYARDLEDEIAAYRAADRRRRRHEQLPAQGERC